MGQTQHMGRTTGVTVADLKGEEWRVIEESPSYYVSNYGRVMRLDGTTRWLINQHEYGGRKGDRLTVLLSEHGIKKLFMVSTLVSRYFLGKPPEKHKLIHKDFDNSHNGVDNLAYANPDEYRQYLMENARRNGRTKMSDMIANRKRRKRDRIDNRLELVAKVQSHELTLKQAGAILGISESAMCHWIKRHPCPS